MNPEKLFIDLDEEIIFIVQKIKDLESDKVILVVPDKASVLGSAVSLKLLSQEIAKVKKDVVMVTTDKVGQKLGEKAGMMIVEKANEIDDKTWERANDLRNKILDRKESLKKELVDERKDKTDQVIQKADSAKNDDEENSQDESEKDDSKPKVVDDELDRKIKKLMEPKVVTVEGIQIAAGGDITKLQPKEKADEDANGESEGIDKVDKVATGSFIGRDLASFKADKYKSREKISRDRTETEKSEDKSEDKAEKKTPESRDSTLIIGNVMKFISSIRDFVLRGGKKNKLITVGLVLLINIFILSYWVLPTAKVTVTFKEEEISFEKQIVADTGVDQIDIENLVLPAELMETEADASSSAATTGESKDGERATGEITIFNKTDEEISIAKDTVLTSIETGLKYITNTAVNVDATLPEDEPLISNIEVGVRAESFGEEYNLTNGKRNEFRIAGFEREEAYGKNFEDLTGGTTETVQSVSQEDYDNLKGALLDQVKASALEDFKNSAGADRVILDDTFQYEIITEEAYPVIDAEAENFDLSIKVSAKVLSFLNSDIDAFTDELIQTEDFGSAEIEEYNYETSIDRVEDTKIYLNIKVTGKAVPNIDESIKDKIKGKGLDESKRILEEEGDIEKAEIKISPSWIPGFIQHIPSDVDKIEIRSTK